MRHNLWMFREGDEVVVCGATYDLRESLKDLYGRWEPKRKAWLVRATRDNLDALKTLGVPLHVKMRREAFCHEDPAIIWIEEGTTELDGDFCGMCDSHWRRPVKVEPVEEETGG